jgi:SOS-response transcriptional repressor LexA
MLDAIAAHWRARGYGPTYAELAETLGLRSKTAVTGSIDALVRKGYLRRDVGVPRSVRLVHGRNDD